MQQVHKITEVDLPYTEMKYGPWFDVGGMPDVKEIEMVLNVSKLEMGCADGSALGVMLERTIDGVIIDDLPFETVNLDAVNCEISKWTQSVVLKKGDTYEDGKPRPMGNKYRFGYFLSQATLNDPKPIPSIASFEAAVIVRG